MQGSEIMTTFYYSEKGVRIECGSEEWTYTAKEISEYYGKPYLECSDVEVGIFWERQAFGWDEPSMAMWVPRKVKYLLKLEKPKIYDLGYQNLSQDEYFQQLKEWGIDYLIDVRWKAQSTVFGKGHKGFDRKDLEERSKKEGIVYIRARALGNPIKSDKNWKEQWKSGYRYYEYTSKLFKIANLLENYDICLLCKERDIADCHRQFIKQDLEQLA